MTTGQGLRSSQVVDGEVVASQGVNVLAHRKPGTILLQPDITLMTCISNPFIIHGISQCIESPIDLATLCRFYEGPSPPLN